MVNFTFVSHKGARPEQSELVKSHVMRESQKKRREAKQRYRHELSILCEQAPAQSAAVRTEPWKQSEDAPQSPLQLDIVPQSDSPNNNRLPTSFSFNGSTTNRVANNERLPSHRLSQPTIAGPSHALKTQSRKGEYRRNFAVSPNFRQVTHGRLHVSSPSSTQTRILGPQFQRLTNTADPSWMPETWLNRVNEIVSHYFMSLNGTGPDARSTLTRWLKSPQKSPIILLSYSLFYCAHRDLIVGIVGNDDHYFKARNLQLINAALEHPSTALADETIVAVINMALYENLRGSDHVLTHARGLRQMFDMRGGIAKFMSEDGCYIGNFALLVDMLRSSCSNKAPLFFDVKGPVLRDVHVGPRKAYFPHSPLFVVNDPGFNASVPILELRSSLGTLRDAFDSFEMLCVEAFDLETVSKSEPRSRICHEKFWMRLQTHDSSETDPIPTSTEGKVHEAIQIAGKIHFYAVLSRVQHDDELNTVRVGRLHDVLKKLRLDFWKSAPYLYLWM